MIPPLALYFATGCPFFIFSNTPSSFLSLRLYTGCYLYLEDSTHHTYLSLPPKCQLMEEWEWGQEGAGRWKKTGFQELPFCHPWPCNAPVISGPPPGWGCIYSLRCCLPTQICPLPQLLQPQRYSGHSWGCHPSSSCEPPPMVFNF